MNQNQYIHYRKFGLTLVVISLAGLLCVGLINHFEKSDGGLFTLRNELMLVKLFVVLFVFGVAGVFYGNYLKKR